ncbi:MAG: hypothetical protein M3347_10305, partial [Armatimonadota bacterium]|nr:hypothetical protein [Armatimonadota bacterium]
FTRWLGRLQEIVAFDNQFDHWLVFPETWKELIEILAARRHEVLALSGDVHFSYIAEATLDGTAAPAGTRGHIRAKPRICLRQFVCSPFEQTLGLKARRKILAQGWCRRLTYGGLQTRMRPLQKAGARGHKRVRHHLLFGNALALLTLQPQESGAYTVLHQYLGLCNGRLELIAQCDIQDEIAGG